MRKSILLPLLVVSTLIGCQAPPPPPVTDDTMITSKVDGVTLTHRHTVATPHTFTPINETYRALYRTSVMSHPDFSGSLVRYLDAGKTFIVLGEVENHWLAIAETGETVLTGYVPLRAGVKQALYDITIRNDRPRPRKNMKKICIDVGGKSKACRHNDNATWIME